MSDIYFKSKNTDRRHYYDFWSLYENRSESQFELHEASSNLIP